jgi:hypothetical protein
MTLFPGCLRERPEHSRMLRAVKRYVGAAGPLCDVVQPIPRIRDQRATPSCVGQSIAARYHGLTGFDASATDLWTDARRRDGNLYDDSVGTWVSSAIDSATKRGLSPYGVGDEIDSEAHTRRDDLSGELAAYDRRLNRIYDHHVTDGTVDEQRYAIVRALLAGRAVIWTTGVTERFFDHPANLYVDDAEVGIDHNGHAMGVAGYLAAIDCALVQNSWGKRWGGVVVSDEAYEGCCLVPMDVLVRAAWETWIIQVKQ